MQLTRRDALLQTLALAGASRLAARGRRAPSAGAAQSRYRLDPARRGQRQGGARRGGDGGDRSRHHLRRRVRPALPRHAGKDVDRHRLPHRLDGEVVDLGRGHAAGRKRQALARRARKPDRSRARLDSGAHRLRRQGPSAIAPAAPADHAAQPADPHVRLQLSAVGRERRALLRGRRQDQGPAAPAAVLRSRQQMVLWRQHRQGRPTGGDRKRRAARPLLPESHLSAARHEGYGVRDHRGPARPRGEPACPQG